MRRLYPDEYNFYPRTWFLPQQLHEFTADCSMQRDSARESTRAGGKPEDKKYYIVKPDEGAQGEGIYLIQESKEYQQTSRNHVLQEYIGNPLLLDKLKFDFRVYAILYSLEPLQVYLSREGMGRFCTVPYKPPTGSNRHDSYMHLTNYSVNKKSSAFVHGGENVNEGSKRTLSSVFKSMEKQGLDVVEVWRKIEEIICKTLIAIVPELKIEYASCMGAVRASAVQCFQILGFDIILRDNLDPILLEVNSCPSFKIDGEREISPGVIEYYPSVVDIAIKKPIVKEVLQHVAPRKKAKLAKLRKTRIPPLGYASEKEDPFSQFVEMDDDTRIEDKITYEVYPSKYGKLFRKLRIMEKISAVFQSCLGLRSCLRMGATAFRTFTRKCKLTTCGLSNAALDILFIDMQRRWDFMNPERAAGLCFQGFVELFFNLARRKYHEGTFYDSVEAMIEFCESQLETDKEHAPRDVRAQASREEARIYDIENIYITQQAPRRYRPEYYVDYRHQSDRSSDVSRSSNSRRPVRLEKLPPAAARNMQQAQRKLAKVSRSSASSSQTTSKAFESSDD